MNEYNSTSLAVKYDTVHGEVELSPQIIRNFLVSGNGNVSDAEVIQFLQLCHYQKLNPFVREAYLVKYGNSPATLIVGKEAFTKRAAGIPECKGWEAGVTVQKKDGSIERREGSLVLNDEILVAGWCTVYIDGKQVPAKAEPSIIEYNRGTATWKSMPATMIRKVAIVHALREAFPKDFQGMYSEEEMPVNETLLNRKPVEVNTNAGNVVNFNNDSQSEPMETPITKEEYKEIISKARILGLTEDNCKGLNDITSTLFNEGKLSNQFPQDVNRNFKWNRNDYVEIMNFLNMTQAAMEMEAAAEQQEEPEMKQRQEQGYTGRDPGEDDGE